MNRVFYASLWAIFFGGMTRLHATPLIKAAGYGKPDEVMALLDRGADVNEKDEYGGTALMRAALNGRLDSAKILLERGARVDEKDSYGRTALLAVASSGYPEMVGLLLDRGADLLAVDNSGSSALHIAAGFNKIQVIEALLARKCDVNRTDREGRTALTSAASRGRVEAVKLLLSHGAKVNAKDSRGRTALIAAASSGHAAIVGALLDGGAELAAMDDSGYSALHSAANFDQVSAIRLLLDRKFDVNLANRDGLTALLMAAQSGRVAAVRVLLERGAEVKGRNKYGESPLHVAAGAGHAEIVEFLLARGVQLDATNNDGVTALMVAARRGRSAVAKALVARGANIDASSRLGQTAAALAEKEGHEELSRWLKDARSGPAASATARPAQGPPARAQPTYSSDVDRPGYKSRPNPDHYAVVIGVENYADLPPAQFAERDAESMRDHLVALGYPQRNIILVTGARASRAGLVKNVENWLPRNVNERSTVFFYYSGHGAPDPVSGDAYLVPVDGDPQYLDETAYPVKRLYQMLDALKAKRIIVALDSCFSGAGGRSVLAKGTRPLVNKVKLGSAATGRVVSLTASEANQISGSLEEQGHGLFTYYLLRGLNGDAKEKDGGITVRSLYDYLLPNVQDAAHRANREQKPQLTLGTSAGDDDIRLR